MHQKGCVDEESACVEGETGAIGKPYSLLNWGHERSMRLTDTRSHRLVLTHLVWAKSCGFHKLHVDS